MKQLLRWIKLFLLDCCRTCFLMNHPDYPYSIVDGHIVLGRKEDYENPISYL